MRKLATLSLQTTITALFLTLSIAGFGQSFTGTYILKSEMGDTILKLKQDDDNKITGTMAEDKLEMELEGKVDGARASGAVKIMGKAAMFFAIQREKEGKLTVALMVPGKDGEPDIDKALKFSFTKKDGGEPEPAFPTKKANPLSKGSAPAGDPFIGKFKSKDLSITIESAGAANTYKGTITMEGKAYPFTAKKDGASVISGTFESGDDKFEFGAKSEDGTLLVKTGETTYMLLREGGALKKANPLDKGGKATDARPANPLSKPSGEKLVKSEGDGIPGDPDWNVFRHPLGLTVRYPKDWKMQDAPGGTGYLLLPPGVAPGGEELYIIGGQPAEGIQGGDDPRLVSTAEQLIAQIGPLLKRTGEVEKVRSAGGPGVGLTWETSSGARAKMFVTVLKGNAIGITAIGLKDKLIAREPTLRKIFESLSSGEGKRDPRVVGVWNLQGTSSLDARDNVGRLQASSVGENNTTIVIRPDGTCTWRNVSRTIAIGQGVGIDTGDQVSNKRGTWVAGEGKLVLMWDKATPAEFNYEVTGGPGSRQMIFKLEKNKASVWAEGK